ncbi:penicillin acylase family protein [Thermodesulfobacteriota bacterium]
MSIFRNILIVLCVVVLGSSATLYLFFKAPIPKYSGDIRVPGLKAEVVVKTDEYGVPHVFAENERDLFFAQGYLTARERMFQMDVTRLAGRGEMSRLFGERTLDKDKFLKTIGFFRKAQADYEVADPETKRVLQAYTDGVNAYLETVEDLPREYFFLGAEPLPWRPEDCITAALLMSYSLTRSKQIDLVMHQIASQAGEKIYNLIAPRFPTDAPTVSPGFISGEAHEPHRADYALLPSQNHGKKKDPLDPLPFDFAASNWMIFSGSRTTTGRPVFTGSPDLKPTLPALFYLIHLQGEDIDAMGGSLPGVPGVNVLGFNRHIAWSTVNGRGDELDYFIEKINPDNPNQYLTEEGWRDFKIVVETLKIKTRSGLKEVKLPVRISRHGPIISDVMPPAPPDCAMQWSCLQMPFTSLNGLVGLMRAKDFSEFRHALSQVNILDLVFGYADREGNIGYQFTGAIPKRKKGNGGRPVPGWSGAYDWTGFVSYDELPFDYNPDQGYLASFNNLPKKTPYHISDYFMFERASRFKDIMKKSGKIDPAAARRLQLDTVSPAARRWLPLLNNACRAQPDLVPYAALFKNWDGDMITDSKTAALFNIFYLYLMENTMKDEVGSDLWRKYLSAPFLFYVPDLVITRIASQPDHPLYDDKTSKGTKEDRDKIIVRSLKDAVSDLNRKFGEDPDDWQWGKVHQMHFEHLLGSKLFFLNLDPIPTPGDNHTINAGMWDREQLFKMHAGGVIRMAVDFSDLNNVTLISPPGQSGHFMSANYADVAELWAEGGQIKANFLNAGELLNTLRLKP